jgi:hypothetical protein
MPNQSSLRLRQFSVVRQSLRKPGHGFFRFGFDHDEQGTIGPKEIIFSVFEAKSFTNLPAAIITNRLSAESFIIVLRPLQEVPKVPGRLFYAAEVHQHVFHNFILAER